MRANVGDPFGARGRDASWSHPLTTAKEAPCTHLPDTAEAARHRADLAQQAACALGGALDRMDALV